jgi:16S rRNA (cytosine1402-N4)-methyltransferase
MRMDPSSTSSAEELVNTASEAQLGFILREYGEEKSWKAVARRCDRGARVCARV